MLPGLPEMVLGISRVKSGLGGRGGGKFVEEHAQPHEHAPEGRLQVEDPSRAAFGGLEVDGAAALAEGEGDGFAVGAGAVAAIVGHGGEECGGARRQRRNQTRRRGRVPW